MRKSSKSHRSNDKRGSKTLKGHQSTSHSIKTGACKTLKPITSSKSLFRRPNQSLRLKRASSFKTVSNSASKNKLDSTIDVYCRFRPQKQENSRTIDLHKSIFEKERLECRAYKKFKSLGLDAKKKLEINRAHSVSIYSSSKLTSLAK